MTEDRTL